jgi:hypothetical protein
MASDVAGKFVRCYPRPPPLVLLVMLRFDVVKSRPLVEDRFELVVLDHDSFLTEATPECSITKSSHFPFSFQSLDPLVAIVAMYVAKMITRPRQVACPRRREIFPAWPALFIRYLAKPGRGHRVLTLLVANPIILATKALVTV